MISGQRSVAEAYFIYVVVDTFGTLAASFYVVGILYCLLGLLEPFEAKNFTFNSDATFLTGATIMCAWVVYIGEASLFHWPLLVAYSLSYVAVVAFDTCCEHPVENKTLSRIPSTNG